MAANETLSAPITVFFLNIVRWIEPVNGFETYVPISIRSDVFPTSWTVYVENEAGTIIRTFGGTTLDGVVETEWDGNDSNGVPAPANAAYRVLFTLGELEIQGASGGTGSGAWAPPTPVFGGYNAYGIPDYEVTTPLPALPAIFFDKEVHERIARGLLPPLPPLTGRHLEGTSLGQSMLTRRVSIVEAAMSNPGKTSASLESWSSASTAAGFSPPAFNDVIVWREASWNSGEIILARQRFYGLVLPATMNTVYANNLATLRSDISQAQIDDDRLQNRGVYGNSVFVADVANDFDVLLNDLAQPGVRDLYYIGHSNGEAIGYSEGSKNNGITSDRLALALGNFRVRNSPRWDGRWLFIFNKPFRFVFIDGCLSARGTLLHTFGIIPDNDHTRLGKKRRSSIGWLTTTQNSIINQNQSQWSARFWKEWVNVDNGDYDVWLQTAIANATAARPIPQNPKIIGYRRLSWAE